VGGSTPPEKCVFALKKKLKKEKNQKEEQKDEPQKELPKSFMKPRSLRLSTK
jgi:hypothetical protein